MMALDELNRLAPAAFVAALDGIFEHSPWVAERVASLRPFGSRTQLLAAMCAAVNTAKSSSYSPQDTCRTTPNRKFLRNSDDVVYLICVAGRQQHVNNFGSSKKRR